MSAPEPAELRRFLDSYLYREPAFLVDEVLRMDPERRVIEARMRTTRPLHYTGLQRNDVHHPPHVSAAEILTLTGNLGCLHAWFFHGVRWDAGWTGFGNRIHRADFKDLVRLGPDLELESRETRSRVGERRVVLRYEFRFRQQGRLAYLGDQTAMFMRAPELGGAGPPAATAPGAG